MITLVIKGLKPTGTGSGSSAFAGLNDYPGYKGIETLDRQCSHLPPPNRLNDYPGYKGIETGLSKVNQEPSSSLNDYPGYKGIETLSVFTWKFLHLRLNDYPGYKGIETSRGYM